MMLPRTQAEAATKTILVVEDNAAILKLVKLALLQGGSGRAIAGDQCGAPHLLPVYEVLTADSAEKGLAIGLEFAREIHLLISDIVMPGLRGDELAGKIKAVRPSMAVMLMSGYPAELKVLATGGWSALEKPFVAAALLQKVAAALAVPVAMRAGR